MSEQKGRIENTSLQTDIESVLNNPKRGVKWAYVTATIHTAVEDIEVPKVMSLDFISNFDSETSGYGVLRCFVPKGDFNYRIYPCRDNLEVSLTFKELSEGGGEITSTILVDRYKAVFKSDSNPAPMTGTEANRPIEDLNVGSIQELEFELQELFEEVYRFVNLDGSYAGNTPQQILEAAIPDNLNKIRIGGKSVIDAVHVVEPDNKEPLRQLAIPRGVLAKDVPGWLQEKSKGVYTNGIGNFIARFKELVTWFVYPLYDLERFNKDNEKLIIYFGPQDRYAGVDNTYRVEGKTTYIVTTSNPGVKDTAGNSGLNYGSGFRLADSKGTTTKPATITEDGIKADSRRYNTELVNKGRKDQLNFARVVSSKSNFFIESSRIVGKEQSIINIQWDYADPNLIYPGMPCKCVFMVQGEYVEKFGTVLGCLTSIRPVGNPMTSTVYKRDVELKISMEALELNPGLQDGQTFGDRN